MKRMRTNYYERNEEISSFYYDDSYNSYESSYTEYYGKAACYDSFTGMSDDLFDKMQRSFAINVSVACI